MKKLVFGLVIAVMMAMLVAPAAFADDCCEPNLKIEWDGDSVCGVTYNVSGAIEACKSFTQFATSGADIFGEFEAFVDECGTVSSQFEADVDQGDCGAACDVTSTISYLTLAGDLVKNSSGKITGVTEGQMLSLYAASDCEAEMEVYSEAICDYLDTCYDIDVEGCEWVVAADAATVDDGECDGCETIDTLSILSMNEGGGVAEVAGGIGDWGMATLLDIFSEHGEGVLAVEAEGEYVAFDGIQIGDGSLKIIAEYCDGIDVWDYEDNEPLNIFVGIS